MLNARVDELRIFNSLDELQYVRERIKKILEDSLFTSIEKNRIILSVDEALTNVIEHGYPDRRKAQIQIHLKINSEGNSFQSEIIDDCIPFNPLHQLEVDPNDFILESRDGGMGIYNYLHLMKVVYNHRDEGGNHLVLIYPK